MIAVVDILTLFRFAVRGFAGKGQGATFTQHGVGGYA